MTDLSVQINHLGSNQLTTLSSSNECVCVLCEEHFLLSRKDTLEKFLQHLLIGHKLVIDNVFLIADLPRYDLLSSVT